MRYTNTFKFTIGSTISEHRQSDNPTLPVIPQV